MQVKKSRDLQNCIRSLDVDTNEFSLQAEEKEDMSLLVKANSFCKTKEIKLVNVEVNDLPDNREFTQRQEYDYDDVNGRIKLQTQHYFTGIPFKSYRNPFYITVKQQITVIAI